MNLSRTSAGACRRPGLSDVYKRQLLDDGEVDVGRAGCLRVTAGFLPGLAGKLLDGRVEAALGTLDDLLEAFQNLLACLLYTSRCV